MGQFEKCSVVVCSCEGYKDLWYPFFYCLKKNWTDSISEGGPLKGGPQVPEIGLEARGLEDCTITGNTLYRSARREWLKTSENQRSVIANNTGSLAV